jgi:hypothetical protein
LGPLVELASDLPRSEKRCCSHLLFQELGLTHIFNFIYNTLFLFYVKYLVTAPLKWCHTFRVLAIKIPSNEDVKSETNTV